MEIDNTAKKILDTCGIFLLEPELLIEREKLLDNYTYNLLRDDVEELKKKLSSSFLTSLHKEAKIKQRWPLINLVRQILHVYKYKMDPVRKADGYTKHGVKKYKRYFLIRKIEEPI